MRKKIAKTKRELIKRIFAVFSFTTALFIFQACYGDPYYLEDCDCLINGYVFAENDSIPIKGIDISINGDSLATTDRFGYFWVCMDKADRYKLVARDGDQSRNAVYSSKDTTILSTEPDNHWLELVLEEN